MQSGFKNVWMPGDSTFFEMINSPDWVQYVLDLPMVNEPGTYWDYNNASMQLLSDILRKTSEKNASTFAKEALFSPLGISNIAWSLDNEGVNNLGSCCLRMLPHDLAKIGYLYLYDGIWNGNRILPKGWVEEATKRHAYLENSLLGTTGYGYLWWLQDKGFRAEGRGAQHLYVFPEMDLIIVTTGGIWENKAYEIVKQYILPAVKSDDPLQENIESYKNLQTAIYNASHEKIKLLKTSKASAIEKKISGKKITLDPNPYNIKYLSLLFKNEKEAEFTLGFAFDCNENCTPTYNVGLDGKLHVSEGRFGLPAIVNGRWSSKNTFIINLNEIGNINPFIIKMKFVDGQMTGQIEDKKTGLGIVKITGSIEASIK